MNVFDRAKNTTGTGRLSQPKQTVLCNLPPSELRERRAQIQTFLAQTTGVAPLSNGFELEFAVSPEMAHALTDFILFERGCCAGLTYELRSQPDHTKLTLRLTGPAEQIESMRAIFFQAPTATPSESRKISSRP